MHLSPGIVTPQPGETTAVGSASPAGQRRSPAPSRSAFQPGSGLSRSAPAGADSGPGHLPPGSALSGPLHYHLKAHGFAAWDLVISVPAGAGQGRHFVTAMIIDDAGQLLEDAVVVAVGEPQSSQDQTFDELTPLIEAASRAEDSEAELASLSSHLDLAPGGSGTVAVRLANHTASELRGEAQLISSYGSWSSMGPPAMGFTAAAGETSTMTFNVRDPRRRPPGAAVVGAGQGDVLRAAQVQRADVDQCVPGACVPGMCPRRMLNAIIAGITHTLTAP